MNKTQVVAKVNKVGKIGRICCLVGKILLTIVAVILIALFIALSILPKDFVTVKTNTLASLNVNINPFVKNLTDSEMEEAKTVIEKNAAEGSISVDGNDLDIASVVFENGVIHMDSIASTREYSLNTLRPILVYALLVIICALVSIFFASKLCSAFENCESPFDGRIVSGLKSLAYSLIPVAVLKTISESFISNIVNGKITQSFTLTLNLTTVIAILLILFISYIFQYGAELQNESDSTL